MSEVFYCFSAGRFVVIASGGWMGSYSCLVIVFIELCCHSTIRITQKLRCIFPSIFQYNFTTACRTPSVELCSFEPDESPLTRMVWTELEYLVRCQHSLESSWEQYRQETPSHHRHSLEKHVHELIKRDVYAAVDSASPCTIIQQLRRVLCFATSFPEILVCSTPMVWQQQEE